MREPARPDPRWVHEYGPWALVTGASEGIGREVAKAAAARGLAVVLVARRRDRLESLAAEIAGSCGVATRVIAADLADRGAVARVIEETRDLDVGLFAACAGFGTSGRFLDIPAEEELAMVEVNCSAVLAMTKALAGRMARRQRGGIVLMSSLVAFQGVPYAANYAATKAYVQALAEGLRPELAAHGVQVLASAPGPVASGFAARADMRMGRAVRPEAVARETLDALGRRATVRPGWLSKLLIGSLASLPRRARTGIMGGIMAGMTKHQHDASRQGR